MSRLFVPSTPDKPAYHRVRPVPIPEPLGLEVRDIIRSFSKQMMYTVVRDEHTANLDDVFRGIAHSVRNRLAERWFRTQEAYYWLDLKRVYYLSLEFLTGRALLNNILNLGAEDAFAAAMEQLGYRLETLEELEADPALGNGGLGRLAACFLDSATTLGIPFYGYGIRYEYGMFRQEIDDGVQVEAPDNWLRLVNPWEVPRPNVLFPVGFYGRVDFVHEGGGHQAAVWTPGETINAMAYDTMVIGYRNDVVNSLRLWSAKATQEFDLGRFNAGDYVRAVEQKNSSENISKVLYPVDDQSAGKELRLKQQYLFVSATLQDILRRFLKAHKDWQDLPSRTAIQLNDTHPAIAIPEMMRLLVDKYGLEWDEAWPLTECVFSFTNHTVLPEALETWSTSLLGHLLPRHLQIVEEIDRRLRRSLRAKNVSERSVEAIAPIDTASGTVRMANLAIVGSHAVNGVAQMHSELLRESLFRDAYCEFPERFHNVTNGVTPRRWLLHANGALAVLIKQAIGDGWTLHLDELRRLEPFADDAQFREQWLMAKRLNKQRLAMWADQKYGLHLSPDALLDCHVKRIHEYKRQLLAVMHAIALYWRIRDKVDQVTPQTLLFAGKAAPCYHAAKAVIELIHAVAAMIDRDPVAREWLKVMFVPDYGVSHAEFIYPATEISEQISTTGCEASGTGNMKAALNGALIVGTPDGANIEIREHVGEENIFMFGHSAAEVTLLREEYLNPGIFIERDPELPGVIETIASLSREHNGHFDGIVDMLMHRDFYCHNADFRPYADAHARATALYAAPDEWARRSILSVARSGYFSSDRAVAEYAAKIWDARSLHSAFSEFVGSQATEAS